MTVAKPDKSCFVSFYQHIRRFRIYGKDGELKRDVILDILPGQERPEVDDYLRFIHPISVYATDSYIYTLNLDMTTEEIENRKTTPNIQVFDWEGKPLTQYKLDCFINTFVVDEVANKIYELLLKTKIIFMYLIYPDYEMDDFDFFEFFVLCPTCWASITTR